MARRTVRQTVGAIKELAKLRLSRTPFPPVTPSLGREGVFIGPTNSAGQAWAWARALEKVTPEVHAVSARFSDERSKIGFSFEVDLLVNSHYAAHSSAWQKKQYRALKGYRAVIIESGDRVFSRSFGASTASQARALLDAGVHVAVLFHGSDIREPDRHILKEPHSHFAADHDFACVFREITARNRDLIAGLDVPVFVSTPDLLDEVPGATWLPVVVDVERWKVNDGPLQAVGPMRVTHIPSNSMVKGTELIEPLLHDLAEEGWVDYRPVSGLPHAEMPTAYGRADIVIDQFRVGNYGVAACEALAAGRIVVSHVSKRVRELTFDLTGEELPIVEATPDTLHSVLLDIWEDPVRYKKIAASGPDFVQKHHDGTKSGRVLASWLKAS